MSTSEAPSIMDRRIAAACALDGLVAFLVGSFLGSLALSGRLGPLGAGLVPYVGRSKTFEPSTLIPAIISVCAVLVCLVGVRWGRAAGWLVSMVGSLLLAGILHALYSVDAVREHPTRTYLLLGVAFGLSLGGLLVALASDGVGGAGAGRAARLAIAGGLAAGVLVASAMIALLSKIVGFGIGWFGAGWLKDPAELLVIVGAVSAGAAALMARADARPPQAEDRAAGDAPAAAPEAQGTSGGVRRPWMLAVVVIVVAALARTGEAIRAAIADSVLRVSGGASPRRVDAVQTFNRWSFILIAVGVGVVLAGYAYVRGRAEPARWVCTGFGLGIPAMIGLRMDFGFRPGTATASLLIAVVSVAFGVLLTRYADQIAPWDALGVIVAAIALLLLPSSVRVQIGSSTPAQLLLAFGMGLALGSGLTRLAALATATALTTAAGARTAAAEVAGFGALGFAAMLLAGQALAPTALLPVAEPAYGKLPLTGPVIMGITAVVLVLLFGMGRMVDRIRRDIRAEATRPAGGWGWPS
jgi:hypothetical protein